uniref:Uncharacterized protein n=1 Tax=Mycena chlorophos TaxID=658473 RepID=A0ABQ0LG45_MYCCL|nr:predicted protein [Mycena chlorophos]
MHTRQNSFLHVLHPPFISIVLLGAALDPVGRLAIVAELLEPWQSDAAYHGPLVAVDDIPEGEFVLLRGDALVKFSPLRERLVGRKTARAAGNDGDDGGSDDLDAADGLETVLVQKRAGAADKVSYELLLEPVVDVVRDGGADKCVGDNGYDRHAPPWS